jgi:hypothetical protein
MQIEVRVTELEAFEGVLAAATIGLEALVYLGQLPGQADTAGDYRQRIVEELTKSGFGREFES